MRHKMLRSRRVPTPGSAPGQRSSASSSTEMRPNSATTFSAWAACPSGTAVAAPLRSTENWPSSRISCGGTMPGASGTIGAAVGRSIVDSG